MLRLVLSLIIVILASSPVMAEDDFGPRFAEDTPSAFADPDPESLAQSMALSVDDINMDDAAEELQNIMPAAGEETPKIEEIETPTE